MDDGWNMAGKTLQFDGLTVSYGHVVALREVTAGVEPGTVVGLIGPNGSGKSTLIKAVAGVVRPRAGEILYAGRPLRQERTRIAYVPQAREVDWDFPLSARDAVLMGRYRSVGWFRRPGRGDRALADGALGELGLDGLGDRHISQFSGGQQQRIFLARALVQEPEIVLFDEPMTGVDVGTRATINEKIRAFADAGAIVLLATHDLQEVQAVCDSLLCLRTEMVAYGPVDEVFHPDILRRAFGGQLAIFG